MDIAAQIARLLNEMLEADAVATQRLIENRARCTQALADHPTIQVGKQRGYGIRYEVGLLGVLNGLCPETRHVVAVIDDVTMMIQRFEARDWPPTEKGG